MTLDQRGAHSPKLWVIALIITGVLAAVAAGLAVNFTSHRANQLCTPQAVQSLQASWQAKIASSDFADINEVIQQAITATQQRQNYCSQQGK